MPGELRQRGQSSPIAGFSLQQTLRDDCDADASALKHESSQCLSALEANFTRSSWAPQHDTRLYVRIPALAGKWRHFSR